MDSFCFWLANADCLSVQQFDCSVVSPMVPDERRGGVSSKLPDPDPDAELLTESNYG